MTVRGLDTEILAFSDANCPWEPRRAAPARAPLRRPGGRATSAAACAAQPGGHEPGGAVLALRAVAARAGVARCTRSPAATARSTRSAASAYEEVDPRFGHDLSFPYLMVKRGRARVYAPDAVASEKMATDLEDEFRRKVRMFGHCWIHRPHGADVRPARLARPTGRDDLAPAAALRERPAAPGAARDLARARARAGRRLLVAARRAGAALLAALGSRLAAAACACCRSPVLPARHRRDRGRARRGRDAGLQAIVGPGRRARDDASDDEARARRARRGRRPGARARPCWRVAAVRDQARGRRPGLLRQERVGLRRRGSSSC